MTGQAQIGVGGNPVPWRMIGWGGVFAILLLPAIAMNFTDELNWSVGDFIFAALLMGSVGLAMELTARASPNFAYRAGAGAALVASFLTIWANGAVGMIGSEDNPLNLIFLGVLAIALLGAVIARFRPAGMARAMTVAAIAQFLAGTIGLSTDMLGAILSASFAALWLGSAALFHKAARKSGLA